MNGWNLVVGYIGVQLALVILIALLSWFLWDKRFKNRAGREVPPGFVRTEEVSIDPTTGKRQRVYYHPATGERFYKEETE
ncbi:hypothetical protein JQN58_20685 [Aneurinibacillus sp. BA2021]|nr:hypothetical protein [Aneurinibacillus sp. BA2021]